MAHAAREPDCGGSAAREDSYFSVLIAREAMMMTVNSEIVLCNIIDTCARGVLGNISVGLNAVETVYA